MGQQTKIQKLLKWSFCDVKESKWQYSDNSWAEMCGKISIKERTRTFCVY